MGRAHRTAKIILGLEQDDGDGNTAFDDNDDEASSSEDSINLIVDSRLREFWQRVHERDI